jgi:hypothetical protein
MRAESPIAGVSSDDEECDESMKDCVEETKDTSSVEDVAPNQCAGTSNLQLGIDQNKVAIATVEAVVDEPDPEIPSDLNPVNVDTGKRRASLCEEVEEIPTKKTRHADYSRFNSISVVASNGNVIFLPQIPPEIFPAAPVRFVLL